MIVLSLFDGISCGQVSFKKEGIKIDKYYASEIDKYAMGITNYNFPETVQLGDITKITDEKLDELGNIDIVIGGSPCQDLSIYKTSSQEGWLGLEGGKSNLFFHYVRILKKCKPKYFLLENVASMEDKWRDMITQIMGCEPVMINSALVCAAERKRYYWHNTGCTEHIKKRDIVLKDIVIPAEEVPEKYWYDRPYKYNGDDAKVQCTLEGKGWQRQMKEVYNINGKCNTLLCDGDGGHRQKKIYQDGRCRKLMPIEYERLQTLPDNYTEYGIIDGKKVKISDSRRYTAIGNAWTVDVIAHILKPLKKFELEV